MAIYEHDMLLRVFDTFRALDEEATMLEYSTMVEGGLVLDLHIWPYDEYAFVILWYPGKERWLLHVDVDAP